MEITGASGPTMLLCNGLFCSTHYYQPIIEHFSKTHRVVTFDYRGHGKSARAPRASDVTIERLVSDAKAVLDAAGDDPTIVVGHSMGARIALELFGEAQGRVSHLVLLCGSAYSPLGASAPGRLLERMGHAAVQATSKATPVANLLRNAFSDPDLLIRAGSLLGGLGPSTPREPLRALARHVRTLDIELMTSLARSYLTHSSQATLERIDRPVLQIVGGRDDLAPPAHAREVQLQLQQGTTHILQSCTHLAPIERPAVVHDLIEQFIVQPR